jgi:glycerol-3-phosphate dehydrogenase
VRIGLLVPDGGAELLPWVQTICREVLGWDDARWSDERDRYFELWRTAYAPPPAIT